MLNFTFFSLLQRLLDPVKIERWAIVNFSARCDMSRISRELINCGRSKGTLSDFGIKLKKVPLLCDNESAIKLTNNPVQHARTKHIDVRHHFIRDHQQKGDICIESVGTEDQLADIFTKPLDEKRFCKLRNELNILDFSNMC